MTISPSRGQLGVFALLGFGVWLSGAVMFRFGARYGPDFGRDQEHLGR